MLNVLINAYAVSPNWGSEPGMGWNWVVNLAKYCNLYIITEGEWKDDIEAVVKTLPQKDHLHFYYNPLPDRIRKMCWNQGDWRFYWYYRKWQKRTFEIAQSIIGEHHIDVIHQLNMIGFREPGFLWKIKDIPFVWGPVGGMDLMPVTYLKGAGFRQVLFGRLKNIVNIWQYKHHPRVKHAIERSSVLIAAVKGVQDVLDRYYHKSVPLINETGATLSESNIYTSNIKEGRKEFHIIWVGIFDFRKRLDLALKTIALTDNKVIHFHICGTGSIQQEQYYKKLADTYGVSLQCHWHGKVSHDKILELMANSDLFFFTSIMEATSTVVLEAISVGLPILCFNTCGFGPIVQKMAGLVVELTTPEQSVNEFARHINYLIEHKEDLMAISHSEIENRIKLSWSSKAKQMVEIYKNILQERC